MRVTAARSGRIAARSASSAESAGSPRITPRKWTILCVEGVDIQEGFAAFGEIWPRDAALPAITFAFVAGLGVPGAVVEIEAVAAVPAA
jgi:hypothetical protein